MRFTRAAKVAAFPLLTMVLVVALIACQGPVGKAGKDGTVGTTGTTGTTGAAAPPGLDAAAVDTLVFNLGAMGETQMVPLADAFTGGTGDLTYRISSAINMIPGVTYALTKSEDGADMLSVTMPDNASPVAEDMVILVEAKDSAGADDVAYISVRANVTVTVPGDDTPFTVGTQAAESRTRTNETAADYHDNANIVCAMKNTCEVTLVATDLNIRDVLRWMVYVTATAGTDDIADANDDTISASVTNGAGQLDGVVTIIGLKAGTAMVRVWAVDEGDMPVTIPDTESTTNVDESRPWPDALHTMTVTVDPAPILSEDAIEAVTMDLGEMEIVGTVFDLGDPVETFAALVITPTYPSGQRIAEVMLLPVVMVQDQDTLGRTLQVTGRNSGTVSITVKVSETTVANTPDQYVEHTFTATVLQIRNS